MLNHARTLLMNVPGTAVPYDVPGEELIPETFKPVVLNRALLNARTILFGASPDRHMLNYRCKEFMGILHATDLVQFVYALDKRISYDARRDSFSSNMLFGSKVVKQANATKVPALMGKVDPPDDSGHMQQVWTVRVVDSDTVETTLISPEVTEQHQYTMTNGMSNPFGLPRSNVKVALTENQTGAQWRITYLTRPELGPGQLRANLQRLPADNIVAIFQLGTADAEKEPFKTFYQLWEKHNELAYQLGSFLLAMIYSTEKLR